MTATGWRRAVLWGLLGSKVLAGWGVQWDIQWHVLVGRDSFWIPPHVMTYAGVALAVLLSWGVLAWETLAARGSRPGRGTLRVFGLSATRGFHLAAWGIALTVLAAPVDDLWHRLFGLDVTLWSPPHLLGIVGAAVNNLGCLLIAGEVHGPGTARTLALVVGSGLLYGNLHLIVQPSNLVAWERGGIWFHTLPLISAAVLPLALVPAARLSGRRCAPLGALAVVILVGVLGQQIAAAGFAALQPVSVIEEEIARDPTSPPALATRIARLNGSEPGRTGGLAHLPSLLPVAVLVAVDARRRPVLAVLGYAATLFFASAWVLAGTRAFAPLVPGAVETVAALALTMAAALGGGVLARATSDRLAVPLPGQDAGTVGARAQDAPRPQEA